MLFFHKTLCTHIEHEDVPCNFFQIFLAFRNVFSKVGSYVPGIFHALLNIDASFFEDGASAVDVVLTNYCAEAMAGTTY